MKGEKILHKFGILLCMLTINIRSSTGSRGSLLSSAIVVHTFEYTHCNSVESMLPRRFTTGPLSDLLTHHWQNGDRSNVQMYLRSALRHTKG